MNTLDDKTIYVFVRGDLAEEQQLVQALHAVFHLARVIQPLSREGEPRVIALDGGQSEKAFRRTYKKLCDGMLSNREVAGEIPAGSSSLSVNCS